MDLIELLTVALDAAREDAEYDPRDRAIVIRYLEDALLRLGHSIR